MHISLYIYADIYEVYPKNNETVVKNNLFQFQTSIFPRQIYGPRVKNILQCFSLSLSLSLSACMGK